MLDETRARRGRKHPQSIFPSWRLPKPAITATAIFLLTLLVYVLLIPKIMHSWNPTGDEPHYLVIVKSLVFDHDLDLRNNYDQGPDIPHVVVRPDGTWSPAHDIGLPLVMYLPFYLGGEFGVYVMLAIIAALIGCNIFLLAFELTHRFSLSVLAWLFTAFLPPGFLYAFQIYPEMLGALLLIWCLRLLIRDRLAYLQWILVGIMAGCMPWLVGRFAPLSVFITLAGIYAIYKFERHKRRTALFHLGCLVIPEMLLATAYILFLLHYYGSASPMALHPNPGIVSTSPGILGFVRLSLGWLIDQRMGLFIFSPILILSIAGMISIWRLKDYRYRIIIIFIVIYYFMLTYLSGDFWVQFSIPTRYLIVIIPLLMMSSAYALVYSSHLVFRIISVLLIIISLSNAVIVINNQNLAYSVYFNKSPLLTAYSKKVGVNLTEFLPLIQEPPVTLKFNVNISDTSNPLNYTSGYFIPGFDILQGSIISDPSATFGRAAYIDQSKVVNGPWLTAAIQVSMPPGEVMLQIRAKYIASGGQLDQDATAFTVIVTSNETGEEIQRRSFRIGELDQAGDYKILQVSLSNPKSQVLRLTIDYDAPSPLVLDFVNYKSVVRWWPSCGLVIIWGIIITLFTTFALWRRPK